MGANLSSCAGGGRRSSVAAEAAYGSRKPSGRSAKGAPTPPAVPLRSRPEVVPVTDGELRAQSSTASSSGGAEAMHCSLDPVPDVLPLEAAAQWAREKRQSRRQNSTPATPVSLTFVPTVDGTWQASATELTGLGAPSDEGDCHSAESVSVQLRQWPSSTGAATAAAAAANVVAGAAADEQVVTRASASLTAAAAPQPGSSVTALSSYIGGSLSAQCGGGGGEAEPIVLQPVPKRHNRALPEASTAVQLRMPQGGGCSSSEVVTRTDGAASAAASASGTAGKPPAVSRLFSMPLPPIPVQQTPGLPPKPKHLSLGPHPLAHPGCFRSPESPPPPPPRCRPTLLPSVESGDWASVDTLAETASLGQAHWDIVAEDSCSGSGSGELACDSLSACASEPGHEAGSPAAVSHDDGRFAGDEDGDRKPHGGGKGHGVTFADADDGSEAQPDSSGPAATPAPAKCPRKPPRTYSYKAASQPKRISHTTEEFEEMWDTMRRALSMERLAEDDCENGGGDGDESTKRGGDDDDIYQNMYATRMRCWQVLSLAQEAFMDLVDPDAILDFLHDQRLLSDDDYDAIVNVTADRRERNDAVIDLLLEHGDGYYDKCREFLRNSEASPAHSHAKVGRILDALNETFIIGSKANHWSFSLTTRQCSVGYDDVAPEDDGDGRGDDSADRRPQRPRPEPSVRLDIYQENFGNRSCAAVADMLAAHDVVSRLSLVKNGISRAGVQRLAPGLVGRSALRQLSLRLNPLRNDGLAELASLALSRPDCRLVELSLSHTGLRRGAGALLAEALSAGGVPCLRRLDVSHNELDDVDCAELAGGLERRRQRLQQVGRLAELCLRNNAFGSAGCRSLCDAMASAESGGPLQQQQQQRRAAAMSVKWLDVGQNAVGDAGASAIAESLLGDGGLVELHIEKCGITAVGCSAIAKALAGDRRLEALFVSGNRVGDEGMCALATALASNVALRVLCADLCADVGDVGLAAVLRALAESNRSLVQFSACYLPGAATAAASAASKSLPSADRQVATDDLDAKAQMDQLVARARSALSGRKVSL